MNSENKYQNSELTCYLSMDELQEILGLTIKRDQTNKTLAFLALLSAYTEDSQLNISFNAPSSSGKSFIPLEVAKFFPFDDVIEVGYCSPTAFFHDHGVYSKEKAGYTVDLSKKILIFLDQPHTMLLQHLRPFLSHDKKEIRMKITDKSQKAGLRTKNIDLIGFPVVIFCSAGLQIDEQESTRFLLLSPEITQEKIHQAIQEKVKKESDGRKYFAELEANPQRQLLKDRVKAIKEANIKLVKITNENLVKELFYKRVKKFQPRHQRDIARITSIIKVLALLNLWSREQENSTLFANDDDIKNAFKLWDCVSVSQEFNLPPYVYGLFQEVILPAFAEANASAKSIQGITKSDILRVHFEIYGRHLASWQLRQEIIPSQDFR